VSAAEGSAIAAVGEDDLGGSLIADPRRSRWLDYDPPVS
jgi:hypothetical protein